VASTLVPSRWVIVPPDGNLGSYLSSLERLLERDDDVFWPTHGPPVTDPEPLPDGYPLWDLQNCIVTPHIAGVPREALRRLGMTVAQRIIDELKDQ